MPNILNIVTKNLLEPNNLDESKLTKILSNITTKNINYADLYFENTMLERWSLEEGIVKSGNFNQNCGVGIRAIASDKTGFAYTNSLDFNDLLVASNAAKSVTTANENITISQYKPLIIPPLYTTDNPLLSLSHTEKVEFLQQIEQQIRQLDHRIIKVNLSLIASYTQHLVVANDGTLAADILPMVRFSVAIIVQQNGRSESGSFGGGGRYTLNYFLQNNMALSYAHEALRQALVQLDAIDSPAGIMEVVLGNGWCGVLLHEAVGHGLEGDFNRKGTSIYSGKIGQKVASDLCTIVDNGTLPNRRGSITVDDEGTKTQETVLIENGILYGFMYDKLNASLMNTVSTGNGRRESYSHLPIPRMTNTYMLAGKSDPSEIIQSVKNGLYCVSLSGGQVDITNGKFVFDVSEAYLIKNGKITSPVKGAALIGSGFEVMQNITMLGNDLELDSGIGVCGKDGQSVPVGVGQPTLKISQITVGGTGI